MYQMYNQLYNLENNIMEFVLKNFKKFNMFTRKRITILNWSVKTSSVLLILENRFPLFTQVGTINSGN